MIPRGSAEGSWSVGLARRAFNRPIGLFALVAALSAGAAAPPSGATAHSVTYERGAAVWFRTTPDNADYQAKACLGAGLVSCGDFITRGDGEQFAADCASSGQTAADVARVLRRSARLARGRNGSWRVYTRTERGGYPYSCRFGILPLRAPE